MARTDYKQIHLNTADYEVVEALKPEITKQTGKSEPSMPDVVMFLATYFKKMVQDNEKY